MDKKLLIGWAAGIFEGEGSFIISKEKKSKGIHLTSTDKDVVDRLKDNFGGKIYIPAKRKAHWKDSYVWAIHSEEALSFYKLIEPLLLARRSVRGKEWLSKRPIIKNNKIEIERLYKLGNTHEAIAEALGLHRTTVTKSIGKNKFQR